MSKYSKLMKQNQLRIILFLKTDTLCKKLDLLGHSVCTSFSKLMNKYIISNTVVQKIMEYRSQY